MKFEQVRRQSKEGAPAEEVKGLKMLVMKMHEDQWPKNVPNLDENTRASLRDTWRAFYEILKFHKDNKNKRFPADWEELGHEPPERPVIVRERDGIGEVLELQDADSPYSLYASAVEAYDLDADASDESAGATSETPKQQKAHEAQFEDETATLGPALLEGYEALLQNLPRARDENDEVEVSQPRVKKTVDLTNILNGLLRVNEGTLSRSNVKEAFEFVGLPLAPATYAGFNSAGKVTERSINVHMEDPFPFQVFIAQLQESVERAREAARKA